MQIKPESQALRILREKSEEMRDGRGNVLVALGRLLFGQRGRCPSRCKAWLLNLHCSQSAQAPKLAPILKKDRIDN